MMIMIIIIIIIIIIHVDVITYNLTCKREKLNLKFLPDIFRLSETCCLHLQGYESIQRLLTLKVKRYIHSKHRLAVIIVAILTFTSMLCKTLHTAFCHTFRRARAGALSGGVSSEYCAVALAHESYKFILHKVTIFGKKN
jgi:hypothetical protein